MVARAETAQDSADQTDARVISDVPGLPDDFRVMALTPGDSFKANINPAMCKCTDHTLEDVRRLRVMSPGTQLLSDRRLDDGTHR